MAKKLNPNRWGKTVEQNIMYKLHGKKAVIMELTNAEKIAYPELKVGRGVVIDHQYSPDNTELYVNDFDGNCIGRVKSSSLLIEIDKKTARHETPRSRLIQIAKFIIGCNPNLTDDYAKELMTQFKSKNWRFLVNQTIESGHSLVV